MSELPLRSFTYSIFRRFPEVRATTYWVAEEAFRKLVPDGSRWQPLFRAIAARVPELAQHVLAEQVHGCGVAVVSSPGEAVGADGLVSDTPELNLVIRTADCAAIMVYDPEHGVVANLHAGWRGARENIISRGISLLQRIYQSRPENLVVAISPFIRECCYQVGEEFRDYFSEKYLEVRGEHLYLNLARIFRDQLLDVGVVPGNLEISSQCTHCHPDKFPSYRRTGSANRMFHAIYRKS